MQTTMESLPNAVLIMILPYISFFNQIVIGENTMGDSGAPPNRELATCDKPGIIVILSTEMRTTVIYLPQ